MMIDRALIAVGLVLILAVVVGSIAGLIALDRRANDHDAEPIEGEPVEHHGWDDDTTVLDSIVDETRAELAEAAAEVPAELALATYTSRHHEDTVEIRPANWMPPIGTRRIALLTDTQQFAAVTA